LFMFPTAAAARLLFMFPSGLAGIPECLVK
jgi:hypothetical protein